jgi:hypothetical protein
MDAQLRNEFAMDYRCLVRTASLSKPPSSFTDLYLPSVMVIRALDQMPQAEGFIRLKAIMDADHSSEDVRAGLAELRNDLMSCDPLWIYEADGNVWEISKVHGDGDIDQVGLVASEATAQMIINHCNGADEQLPGCNTTVPVKGYLVDYNIKNGWDLINEEGDWIAAVSTKSFCAGLSYLLRDQENAGG